MLMFVDEESESAMGDESALGFSGRSRCCFCVSGELFISQQKFSEEVGDGSSADGGVDFGLGCEGVCAGLAGSSCSLVGVPGCAADWSVIGRSGALG